MNCAGTEKSFLSFASNLDYEKYDVDLLLAVKKGPLLSLIPKEIRVLEMPKYGEFFELSGKNTVKMMLDCFVKKNPLHLFEILPYFLGILLFKKKKTAIATKMWIHFMKKMPEVQEPYDVAVSYWGDRTMFYMCDKVKAKKKITWLHFDYGNPKREDRIYLRYFHQCDKIVSVSEKNETILTQLLPEIRPRCMRIENINDPTLLKQMAATGETFSDFEFSGKRLLSIGRISEQKGFDFIPEALQKLKENGFCVRWYILGDGDSEDIENLKQSAQKHQVSDSLILLGTTLNPYRYLNDCDIYVQPSRYEGKPLAVEEAKMLAKPIVVSQYLSAPEQLEDGKLGIITPIGSEGIYQGLKRMLSSDDLRKQFQKTLSARDFGNQSEIQKFEKAIE